MKKIIISILIAVVALPLAAVAILLASISFGYDTHSNVSYGSLECETMDVYIPHKTKEHSGASVGAVIFIHGGSWTGGDKREEEIRCRYLASRGYITATMNYSLYSDECADTYTVSAVMDQINSAIERLISLADEEGILIDRVATSGYSAGAHLSMLYAFSREDEAPVDICFSANLAGPADITPEIWGDELAVRIGEMLSGEAIDEDDLSSVRTKEMLKSISPVSFVNADTPPTIFVYGGKDTTVSKKNGDSLVCAFESAGAEYEYIFMPNSDHSLLQDLTKHMQYMLTLKEWCGKYL